MKRSGFTMIEMLVVLSIILLLFGLTMTVITASMDNARADATRTTVSYIDKAIEDRIEALGRNNVRSHARAFMVAYNVINADKIDEPLARVIVTKDRFQQALPTRLEDMFGLDGTPGTQDDSPLWRVWKKTMNANGIVTTDADIRPTGHIRENENAELLYLFLTEGATYGEIRFRSDDIITRHLRDSPIDTDGNGSFDRPGNGIPEIIDEWGNRIRFYGWTHKLTRPGGGTTDINQPLFTATAGHMLNTINPPASPVPFTMTGHMDSPLNQDPDDPYGRLSAAQNSTGFASAPYQIRLPSGAVVTCKAFNEDNYHPLDTYSIPLVVSAGPDGVLGLVEPTGFDPMTGNYDADLRTAEPLGYRAAWRTDAVYDNITAHN